MSPPIYLKTYEFLRMECRPFRAADRESLGSYLNIFAYHPAKTPAWKQHAFLVTSTTAIASPPTVATGVCGDDAVAVYPLAAGAVQITRLRGATWSAPENVGTLSNLTFASVATTP